MKIKLELVIHDDGTTCLNYWDTVNANDVTAQLINGQLYTDWMSDTPIETLGIEEFIQKVKQVVDNQ